MGTFVSEDNDDINAGERGEDSCALAFWYKRAVRAFKLPAGGIGVETDDKEVAELPGALKIADVAKMEQVKATIGGDNTLMTAMGGGGPASGLSERQELGGAWFRHGLFILLSSRCLR